MTGQIKKTGVSSAWYQGRDYALVRMNVLNGYSAVLSTKTAAGTWEIGTYDSTSWANMLIFTYTSDSNYSAGTNSNSAQVKFINSGGIVANGEVTAGSDMRYKTPIAPITTIAPEKISKAPLFTFTWKNRDDTAIHLGSSAQYWQEIFPELVTGEDFLTLNYGALGTALGILNSRRIDTAEQRIAKLERENKKLKKEIKILKAERL
jgi:hypothetical protein